MELCFSFEVEEVKSFDASYIITLEYCHTGIILVVHESDDTV